MDWKGIMELLNVVIWPIVVGIALFLYRKSLSRFIAGLGQRVTKLSVFDVSIELAALPVPPSPWSESDIAENTKMIGGEVDSTAIMTLFESIGADKPLDYLIVDVKDGRFWFVSRVFIFTVFLQAMRGLKCVVFVQTIGENRRRLLGLASPEAVYTALRQAFPWMRTALNNALSNHGTFFLDPARSSTEAGNIIKSFMMQLTCKPDDLTKPDERVRLEGTDIWEHTHWLDFGIRQVSEAVKKSFYEQDSSHYKDSPDVSTEERTRALLFRKAPYVALVNSQHEFKALIDRQKLIAIIGETLIKE